MNAKLSPTQLDVIEHMKADGARLVRMSGGFWTTPNVPMEERMHGRTPTWWCGVQTVRALEKLGLVERANEYPEWCDPRVLVEEGR